MIEIIKQFRWQDLVDIIFVSIIFYRILLLIKGTRAAQMIIGLGVLLMLSFLSKYMHLYTLDWLIQSFWSQLVIVLIILFHPEIRKALAKVGESSFFQRITPAEEMKSLDEIVKATIALSDRKIGALIILEREVSLKEHIEIGTPLDAKVSKELLLSIFHPTSPIHDGAVIISNNRIVAAGCFLPITLGANVSKTLGTRHRAAMGITEETDAVAIVVSEETGFISTVIKGKLESRTDAGSLRDFLTSLFAQSQSYKKGQRQSISQGQND